MPKLLRPSRNNGDNRHRQVRGFALANITFVKGDTGWIVFDPTEASESARAAKDLLDEHV